MEGERREKLYDDILIFKHLKIREHLEPGKYTGLVKRLLYKRELLSLDSHSWEKSKQGVYL